MLGKVDLVMWTKNGAATLPIVLKRIGNIVPTTNIGQKIIVDDKSTDSTTRIAVQNGWQVIPNSGTGISDGANTALREVRTEWFASFEQDLLLASDWWHKVPRLLEEPSTSVASGIRIPNSPSTIKKIEEYEAEKYLSQDKTAIGLEAEAYGKTLDNTIYKTDVIRRMGGFPKLPVPAGIDTILNYRLAQKALKWAVDFTARSTHLRTGLRDELRHYRFYSQCVDAINQIQTGRPYPLENLYRRFLLGPFRGFEIALKMHDPQIIYVYPLIRLEYIRGISIYRRKMRA